MRESERERESKKFFSSRLYLVGESAPSALLFRSLITENTHPDSYYGGRFEGPAEDHGTTHISIIDRHGNVVSVTSTINL